MAYGLPPVGTRMWCPTKSIEIDPKMLDMIRAPQATKVADLPPITLFFAALLTALQDQDMNGREKAIAITQIQTAALFVNLSR